MAVGQSQAFEVCTPDVTDADIDGITLRARLIRAAGREPINDQRTFRCRVKSAKAAGLRLVTLREALS